MIWVQLALFAVSFITSQLTAPKPNTEDARAASLDDFDFPRSDEGDPVPWIAGTIRLNSPNTLWYGDYVADPVEQKIKRNLFSSTTVITGYRYYIGFDLGLCLGPEARIRRIWIDDKLVFSGGGDFDIVPVAINKPDLFGGDDRGGGFQGPATFYAGEFDQIRDTYMTEIEGDDYPAYTGQAHIVFKRVYIGTSPQLRKMSFELERMPNPLGLSQAINEIGKDINPISALYDLMTSAVGWGGAFVDPADIDDAAFEAAATTLAAEENGCSIKLARPNEVASTIQEILRQIDGVLYQDPSTGKITITLIRFDYDVNTLPVFDASNIEDISDFTRSSWVETYNQMKVTFTSREKFYSTGTGAAQDLANINAQGKLRSNQIAFPLCTEAELANKLAARELSQQNVPLFQATMQVNRQANVLRPGAPFVLVWPKYRLVSAVMRVTRLRLGELLDGRIVAEVIQDSFSAGNAVFAPPTPTLWNPITRDAVDATDFLVTEAPYWIVTQFESITPEDGTAWVMGAVRRPQNLLGFNLLTSGDAFANESINDLSRQPFNNSALLAQDIRFDAAFATGIIPTVDIQLMDPSAEIFNTTDVNIMVQDGVNLFVLGTELMACLSVTDHGDGTATLNSVYRALLDTSFEEHVTGDALFLLSANYVSQNPRGATDVIEYKITTFSDVDAQEAADVTAYMLTLNQRYDKPAPPDFTLINGFRTPGLIDVDNFQSTWTTRSRLSENIALPASTPDQTPEADTTYNARFYINGYLVASNLSLASPLANFIGLPERVGMGSLEVDSSRPSVGTSWTRDIVHVPYVNPGAVSDAGLVNGDFETGDTTGWTVTPGEWSVESGGTPGPINTYLLRSLSAIINASQTISIAVPDRSRMALVTLLQASNIANATGSVTVEQLPANAVTAPSRAVPTGEWHLRMITLPLDGTQPDLTLRLTADAAGVDYDEVRVQLSDNTTPLALDYDTTTGITAVVGAWSLRRVVSSYTGPLVRVVDTRTGTEFDLGLFGNDLAGFSQDGPLEVVTWYDQSGNGADLKPADASNRPVLTTFDTATGRASITFNQGSVLIDQTVGTTRPYMATRPNVMASIGPRLVSTLNAAIFIIPQTETDPSNRRWGLSTAAAAVFTTSLNNNNDNFAGSTVAGKHTVFIDYQNGATYFDDPATNVDTFTAADVTYPFDTRIMVGNNPGETLAWEGGTLNELVMFTGDLAVGERTTLMDSLQAYWFNL